MTNKEIKEIREILRTNDNVKFHVEGYENWRGDKTLFSTHKSPEDEQTFSIWNEVKGMNINKFGPTCISLYSFNMLGKKTTGKIKYEDITIIVEEK